MCQNFDFHHHCEDKFSYIDRPQGQKFQKSSKIIKNIEFLKFYEEQDLCARILIFITIVKINFQMLLYILTDPSGWMPFMPSPFVQKFFGMAQILVISPCKIFRLRRADAKILVISPCKIFLDPLKSLSKILVITRGGA